jgi:hypothetical protein
MVSSGHVSKIYAGKTKQSEVRIYLPGTARESGVYFLRPHLGVHVAGAGISLRLNCPETRSFEVSSRHFGPRRDFGRVRAGTARASKFVPAATALSAAVLLTQFAKITKASGRPAQAISWWCFFSLALYVYVWRLKTHCSECDNKRSALFIYTARTAPRPHLTKKKGRTQFQRADRGNGVKLRKHVLFFLRCN